ncbi:hypothetical protein CDAR_56621 [Caerostris darwini]|uniref:Flagellar protein FlgN n=1 Tax=Caerostris darwini TaxID=1538125 RepID=A0AAV4Q280_9ARAC|nr:hypothetical protein CDAR_56621 [Caerostris darwini]
MGNEKENKRLTEKSGIRLDEETPFENKSEILELVNEVRDCFATKLSELGCTLLTKIEKKFDLEVNQTMSVGEQVLIQRDDPELDKTISIFKKRKFERHKDWDLIMKELDRNLNNGLNKITNKTPSQMLHGYSPRLNDGTLRKTS